MAKWSATTLLRELQDFQEKEDFADSTEIGEVKKFLGDAIIKNAIEKSSAKQVKGPKKNG